MGKKKRNTVTERDLKAFSTVEGLIDEYEVLKKKLVSTAKKLGINDIGDLFEVDHLVEKRFQRALDKAGASLVDDDIMISKVVPRNQKIASQIPGYKDYPHLKKTSLLKELIPHGLEELYTPQQIWDAHAKVLKKLGLDHEIEWLKNYFRDFEPDIIYRTTFPANHFEPPHWRQERPKRPSKRKKRSKAPKSTSGSLQSKQTRQTNVDPKEINSNNRNTTGRARDRQVRGPKRFITDVERGLQVGRRTRPKIKSSRLSKLKELGTSIVFRGARILAAVSPVLELTSWLDKYDRISSLIFSALSPSGEPAIVYKKQYYKAEQYKKNVESNLSDYKNFSETLFKKMRALVGIDASPWEADLGFTVELFTSFYDLYVKLKDLMLDYQSERSANERKIMSINISIMKIDEFLGGGFGTGLTVTLNENSFIAADIGRGDLVRIRGKYEGSRKSLEELIRRITKDMVMLENWIASFSKILHKAGLGSRVEAYKRAHDFVH